MDNSASHSISSSAYNPLRQTSLIKPLDTGDFTSSWLDTLYVQGGLTEDEYLVLDFFNATHDVRGIKDHKSMVMSFQGIKRLLSLHQAKLTKALNRLIQKDLLIKNQNGYQLTLKGIDIFTRLENIYLKTYPDLNQRLPSLVYSHVIGGQIQGPEITQDHYNMIREALANKWFGDFRFTSIINNKNSFELSWISTEGNASISLLVGPNNKLRIIHSSLSLKETKGEIQQLNDKISELIETKIDFPVIFSDHSIYKNRDLIADDAKIYFAG